MKYFQSLQLGLAAFGFSALFAVADDVKAPDRREIWVPTSELKEVLAAHPRAVLLSREQYQALLRDAKKDLKPGEEPPVRAALTSARYTGELGGDVLDVQAEFTVNVLSDDWAEVPLRLGALALGNVKLDGDAAFSGDKESTLLMIRGKGEHKVTAEFMVSVKKDSGVSSVQLSLPRAGAGLFSFNLPPNSQVESSQPVDVKKTSTATAVSLAIGAQNDIVVSWHGTGDSQQASALIFQENSYIYSIDESRIQADLGIVLNAALGSLPGSLQIKIPAGATPLQVVGSEVLKWTANANVLTVDLTPGDRRTVGIRVLLETSTELAPAAANLPLPEVAGVRRSAGKFAVIGSRGVKVKDISAGEGSVQAEGIFDASIEQDARFISGYGFAVQPAAITASIEKVSPRFSADLDTLVELKREAIFIERTLTLHGEEGEIFESNLVMPAGEELISVLNADTTEPDWKADGAAVKIRWSEGLDSGQQRIFKIKSRMEPAKWPETDEFALGDLKIQGAEKVNGYVALKADKMFRVETGGVEGLEKRDGRTTPVKGDFAWFRREAFQLQVKLSRRAPEVQSVLLGYALPVDGALDVHGQLVFNILYSGVNKLRIKVPAQSAEQFYFDGPQIAERNRDGDTWTIVLQKEISGDYVLKFHAVIPFDESKANFQVDIPNVQSLDVKQESGTWAVEANTSTEISFKASGMNELDPLRAPTLADYQPRHHVIGVYGYLGQQHSLKLAGVKHEAAPIFTAVADRLELDTVVSTSGAERHKALFYIRTVGDQFLDVTLPDKSSVWSLTVDDQPLKPVSEKPGVVRVQLPAILDRTRASLVQLIYETNGHEWSSSGGYALVAPRLDARIPVLQSHWRVYLPDGFTYTGFDSNLHKNEAVAAVPTPLFFKPLAWLRSSFSTPAITGAGDMPTFHGGSKEETDRFFAEAVGFLNSGRFDLATKRYDQILAVDPNNIAALKGQEIVNAAKLKYADVTYNTTRGQLNAVTSATWNTATRDKNGIVNIDAGAVSVSPTAYIQNKLNSIIIPRIEFRDASVSEAVSFFVQKSRELDTTESDPARKGVNIMLKSGGLAESKITLSLTNIPLSEALRYVTSLAGLKVKVDPYAVSIVPLSEGLDVLVTKEYMVPKDFVQGTARDFLESNGVVFPPGASASYLPTAGKLVVRNTEANLDIVEALAESAILSNAKLAQHKVQMAKKSGNANAHNFDAVQNKLSRIIIPKLEFRDTSVREAMDILSRKARELDTTESNSGNRGVNILLRTDGNQHAPETVPGEARITLNLTNVPLGEALRYIANLSGMKVKVDAYAATLVPESEPTDVLITKEYNVPPGFLSTPAQANGATGVSKKMTARSYLESAGVEFPPGAAASYLPNSSKLVVRNTGVNFDLIDQIVDAEMDAVPEGAAGEVAQAEQGEEMKAAGILPMKLEFNGVGTQFSFEGFYAAEKVSFHYVDWWSQARRGWIWWLAGGIAFFAASRYGEWRRLVWGMLVLTFIPICLVPSFTGMCNALLAGWVTGFIVYQIAARFVFRTHVAEAQTV